MCHPFSNFFFHRIYHSLTTPPPALTPATQHLTHPTHHHTHREREELCCRHSGPLQVILILILSLPTPSLPTLSLPTPLLPTPSVPCVLFTKCRHHTVWIFLRGHHGTPTPCLRIALTNRPLDTMDYPPTHISRCAVSLHLTWATGLFFLSHSTQTHWLQMNEETIIVCCIRACATLTRDMCVHARMGSAQKADYVVYSVRLFRYGPCS